MANSDQPADEMLRYFLRFGSAQDLVDLVRARNPGDLPMAEPGDGDDDDEGDVSPLWDGVAPPTSSPEGDFDLFADDNEDDVNAAEGENAENRNHEWLQYQLYFSEQARLFNSNNDAFDRNDTAGPSLLLADCFATDDGGDYGDDEGEEDDDEDDEFDDSDSDGDGDGDGDYDDDENVPQVTPLPRTPPPPRRRRYGRRVRCTSEGGRLMLAYALQNLRLKHDQMAAEKARAKAKKLAQEALLQERVLGTDAATSMGLPLHKDANSQVSGGGDLVMKDTFDYRKLATAGARRERMELEDGDEVDE